MKIRNFIQSLFFFSRIYVFPLLFVLWGTNICFGQEDPYLDSLETALSKSKTATEKLSTYSEITQYLLGSDPEKAREYALKGIQLAHKNKENQAEANLYNGLGNSYYYEGNYTKAMDAYVHCLNLNKKLGARKEEGRSYSNIGLVYLGTGNFTKAQDYFIKSLKIREELNDLAGKAYVLSNLSSVQQNIGDFKEGLRYQLECLKIRQSLNDKFQIAVALNNAGNCYYNLNQKEEARTHYLKAVEIYESINDKWGLADAYGNVAIVELDRKNYKSAEKYHFKALNLKKELGDNIGIASAWRNIGSFYGQTKEFDKSFSAMNAAISLFEEAGALNELEETYRLAADVYHEAGDDSKAFTFQKKYDELRTSLMSEAKTRAITEMATKYETEKTAAENEILLQQGQLKDAELAQSRFTRYTLIIGLTLIIIFTGFLFNRFKITNKQKRIIEQQKIVVEDKNKEVLDSITYAKRLQEAILPSEKMVKEIMPESFIYYRPKDIVAGDFYWMERNGNAVYIAAADCTGHGVPGALVSVVCSNALNRVVNELGITEPGKILDKVRELVINQFAKSGEEVRDGMDISLCCLEMNSHKSTTGITKNEERISNSQISNVKLTWAGANNPLWIVKPGGMEITEYHPVKQSIGFTEFPKSFVTHEVSLSKGDVLYLFSDGFADQFGGPRGKKFTYKQLKELLLSFNGKPMSEQHHILNETFNTWKGALEQVDDVCLIGLRV